jgi:RimJ/RimL family protein N-acetyltransferase
VTLRPLGPADSAALALAASESRGEYGYTRVPDSVDDARRYIELALADRDAGRRMPFAIEWHDRVVGSTSYLDIQQWRWPAGSPLQRTDAPDSVEIGATWLAALGPAHAMQHGGEVSPAHPRFDVWAVHRVCLKTDERNARSRRAIERLGAAFEGVRRADMPAQDGSVRNSAYYSIVPAEWPAVRKRLEDALARA